MPSPAVEALLDLLRHRRVCVLTGAGVSTESGIPDYRGPTAPKRKRPPLQHRDFVEDPLTRKRYWARSVLGWPRFRDVAPNPAHRALAEWEARYGAEGYRLVILAVPERQSLDRLRRFHAERHLPGRLLWDATGGALRALDAEGVPAHILLGPGGVELWRGSALAELGESGLGAALEGRAPGKETR